MCCRLQVAAIARSARQPCFFGADEKRIRTKNTVMDKSKGGLSWFSSTITDCERTGSSSARNR
jgi:hypothetical protein